MKLSRSNSRKILYRFAEFLGKEMGATMPAVRELDTILKEALDPS
ncbi:MAG: hypothetical protein ACLRPC_04465 [Streptococcus sp.]